MANEPQTRQPLPSAIDILKETWQIFKQNATALLTLQLIPTIASIILGFLFAGSIIGTAGILGVLQITNIPASLLGGGAILLIIATVGVAALNTIAQLGQIYVANEYIKSGTKVDFKQALSMSKGKILAAWWITILIFALTTTGTFLLIIFGIIMSVWFMFSIQILVAENKRGLTAIITSREYARDYWVTVFVIILVPTLLVLLPLGLIVPAIMGAINAPDMFNSAYQLILGMIITPLTAIYELSIYNHLKKIKGELQPQIDPNRKLKYAITAAVGIIVPIALLVLVGAAIFSLVQDPSLFSPENLENIEQSLPENYTYPNNLQELQAN